ncbi:flavin-containing monooxygenase [Variovorax saccharolyticus]|uniref:flavin-containing monooxygenase n=1 Tax=Variovorax saccharolyticus TaxID=3053516 RepID=UPI0025769506|nr:NAD(P)/FAD-dependent oxidoreductase [Variovorax sp. J31P216]MDM0025521.1 NAD(P)/FAD-dependent oxidoreductase [Variovorax sp. J31P216]
MSVEKINTLVVGAGQAGIAMSEHLSLMGVPHVVLERNRIAERWRSERWDSLVANGPAWHDRFPGLKFEGVSPESFPPKERMAQYFEDYAAMLKAPVRTGVEVRQVERNVGRPGFKVTTSEGVIEASNVVSATGPFQIPAYPKIVPETEAVQQLHSSTYKNPGQLREGAVLVVGAGASGSQIAEELRKAGKTVYLSVGEHYRPPRSYRGRDYCWWLGALGLWDEVKIKPKKQHVAFAVSGYEGGKTVDFRRLAHMGVTLVGLTRTYKDGVIEFEEGLARNVAEGDQAYFDVLREADAYIEQNGLPFAPEPEAWELLPDPDCLKEPIMSLDLAKAGITTILWATGFTFDYSWLKVNAFDEKGAPFHKRGISAESGIYFLGLPNLVNRASSFIYGVWHDAKYIADHIVIQDAYMSYGKT